MLTAPSGCAQAPRRVRQRGEALADAVELSRRRCRARSLRACPPIASRPWTQGPHWRALCPASQRAARAVSATGQALSESSSTMPAPRVAPCGARCSFDRATPCRSRAADPGARVAAEQRSAHARGRAAGGIDQRGQRGPVLDLIDARVGDWTGERHERGARLAWGAELAEPGCAVARDQRDVGERLGVVDQRRAAPKAVFEGHRWRERGLRRAAVEEVDKRRLLAGDVVARHLCQARLRRMPRP